MQRRVTKFVSIILFIVVIISLLVWGGNITKIRVNGDFSVEPALRLTAESCLNQFMGNSFWLLSDSTVRNEILSCEKMFINADVGHSFPGGLQVTIHQMVPLVKIEHQDKTCEIIQNSATKVLLSIERCGLYNLPILKGIEVENNSFVQDFATTLISSLHSNQLFVTSLELKGDSTAPWYHVILSNKTNVLLPSGANSKEKVTVLLAALKGLNTAKERYSTIDLRFDMVTYK